MSCNRRATTHIYLTPTDSSKQGKVFPADIFGLPNVKIDKQKNTVTIKGIEYSLLKMEEIKDGRYNDFLQQKQFLQTAKQEISTQNNQQIEKVKQEIQEAKEEVKNEVKQEVEQAKNEITSSTTQKIEQAKEQVKQEVTAETNQKLEQAKTAVKSEITNQTEQKINEAKEQVKREIISETDQKLETVKQELANQTDQKVNDAKQALTSETAGKIEAAKEDVKQQISTEQDEKIQQVKQEIKQEIEQDLEQAKSELIGDYRLEIGIAKSEVTRQTTQEITTAKEEVTDTCTVKIQEAKQEITTERTQQIQQAKAELAAQIQNASSSGSFSIGDYKHSAQALDHNGWLLCDGRAIDRTTYSKLYNIIGTQFGQGNRTTTFNLPDARGRLNVATGPNSNYPVGEKGGQDRIRLTESQLPPHAHHVQPHAHSLNTLTVGGAKAKLGDSWANDRAVNNWNFTGWTYRGGEVWTTNTGSGSEIEIKQPYIVVGRLFIFSGVV